MFIQYRAMLVKGFEGGTPAGAAALPSWPVVTGGRVAAAGGRGVVAPLMDSPGCPRKRASHRSELSALE